MENEFDYKKTLKTKKEDTFFNIQPYFYISARQITKLLYYTSVTPHQIIFASLIFGIAASFLMNQQNITLIVLGSVLLFYKNVLDKVDGSLARAKGLDSRRGRFYDSISDFLVTLALFTSISIYLFEKYHSTVVFIIGFGAMISSMLQCSFFIYYQVSFIKATGKETVNRVIETVTEQDKASEDRWTLFLHKVFQIIYGWQDFLIYKIDKFLYRRVVNSDSKSTNRNSESEILWYKHKPFLTMASFLSIGTHMVLIAICAVIRSFELYLFINLILMNLWLILCIISKYFSFINKNSKPSEEFK